MNQSPMKMDVSPQHSPVKMDMSPEQPRPPPVSPNAPKRKPQKRKRDHGAGVCVDLCEVLAALSISNVKRTLMDDPPRKLQKNN